MDDLFLYLVFVWLMCVFFTIAGYLAERLQ